MNEYPHPLRPIAHRLSAHRRRPHRPVQLAADAPARRHSSSCASTTPTPSATSPKRCSRSSTAFAGSASTGTKARKSAGRTARTFSRSAARLYIDAAMKLLEAGHAYPDYMTKEQLDAERKAAEAAKKTVRPSRPAPRHAAGRERAASIATKPAALRLKVPAGRTVVIDDLIRGRVEVQTDTIGDPVILRRRRPAAVQLRRRSSTTSACRSRTSSARPSICRTRRCRCSIYEALGYPHADVRPCAGGQRAGLEEETVEARHEEVRDGRGARQAAGHRLHATSRSTAATT